MCNKIIKIEEMPPTGQPEEPCTGLKATGGKGREGGGRKPHTTTYPRVKGEKIETHLAGNEGANPVNCTAAIVDAAAMERTPRTTTVRPLFVLAGPVDQMSESERTGCS